jgi:hypothetical protein
MGFIWCIVGVTVHTLRTKEDRGRTLRFLLRVFTKGQREQPDTAGSRADRPDSPTDSGDEAPQRPMWSRSASGGASLRLPDMPRELWLYIQITRSTHTWGEADATHSLRKAFFCSVQPGCVHDRERPRDSSVSIPAHFASILVPFPHRETCSLTKEQKKRHRQLMRTRQGDSGGHVL